MGFNSAFKGLNFCFSSDVKGRQTDGRTDRQTDMTMLIVASCNFAKAPKNRQGKIYHVGAINAYGGSEGDAPPILNLGTGRRL